MKRFCENTGYFQRSNILNYFQQFYNVAPQMINRVLNPPNDYMASFFDTNSNNNNNSNKLNLLIEEKKQFPKWYDLIYGNAQKNL